MTDKGIGVYLLISFLGAWGLWLIGWVLDCRVFRISPSNLSFQFVLLPGALIRPFSIAFVLLSSLHALAQLISLRLHALLQSKR
jgi:hypothetical protein